MKNVIKPIAKIVLIPLLLTAAASAADAGIYKKHLRFHNNSTYYIEWSNRKHCENIKSLEDSGVLLKGVSETSQNEAEEQKGKFLVCY